MFKRSRSRFHTKKINNNWSQSEAKISFKSNQIKYKFTQSKCVQISQRVGLPCQVVTQYTKLRQCFSEIEQWMASSYLKLNPSKTELLFISSRTNKTANPIDYDESFSLCVGLINVHLCLGASTESRSHTWWETHHEGPHLEGSQGLLTLHNLRCIGDKLSKKNN